MNFSSPAKAGRESIFDNCIEMDTAVGGHPRAALGLYDEQTVYGVDSSAENEHQEIDQATKGGWWMPWRQKAKKDVVSCDKLR
jgi:hypothetical protein